MFPHRSNKRRSFGNRFVGWLLVVSVLSPFMCAQSVNAAVSAGATRATQNADTVVLPRYRAANPSSAGAFSVTLHDSDNLLAASDEIKVQGSIENLMSWYEKTMPKFGYVKSTVDTANEMLTFVAKSDPNLTVSIKFTKPSYGSDRVYVTYYVTSIKAPVRPTNSLVPSNATRLVIRYEAPSATKEEPWMTRTITSKEEIAKLVNATNRLPVDIRTDANEHSSLYGGATLQFVTTSGRRVNVDVHFQNNQVVVDHVTLFDMQNTVWQLVREDMNKADK